MNVKAIFEIFMSHFKIIVKTGSSNKINKFMQIIGIWRLYKRVVRLKINRMNLKMKKKVRINKLINIPCKF